MRRSSREDRKDEKKHVRQSARCREKETMLDFGFYSFHFWPHEPVFIVKRKTTIVHCNPKVGRRVTDIILIEKATHRLYLWYVYVHNREIVQCPMIVRKDTSIICHGIGARECADGAGGVVITAVYPDRAG